MPPYRSPGYDALEGRHLLSAGNMGATPGGEIVIVGPPVIGFEPRPAELAPMVGPQRDMSRVDGPVESGQFDFGSHQVMGPESASDADLASIWAGPQFLPIGVPSSMSMMVSREFSAGGPQPSTQMFAEGPTGEESHWIMSPAGFSPDFVPDSIISSGGASADGATQPTSVGIISITTNVGSGLNPGPGGGGVLPMTSTNPSGWDLSFSDDPGDTPGAPQIDVRVPNPSELALPANSPPPGQPYNGPPPKGRAEPNASGPAQPGLANNPTASNGTLISVSQQGLVATPEIAQSTSAAGRGMDGPIAVSGTNAPGRPVALHDTDGVTTNLTPSVGDFPDHGIGIAEVGRVTGHSRSSSNASGYFHWIWSSIRSGHGGVSNEWDPELSEPRGADLIAEALPFARESLEDALEDFVRQLRGVDLALFDAKGPGPIVFLSAGVLASAVSAEVVRRYMQRRGAMNRGILALDASGRQHTMGFPELPGSWSARRP